jgi:mannose-6-phosphate isomerase-like protein (cupin superfamily)
MFLLNMTQLYELNNVLTNLENQGGYFINIVSRKGIQADIIRLHNGENDTQEPHSVDEVYYVIEGNGFIKIDGSYDHSIVVFIHNGVVKFGSKLII